MTVNKVMLLGNLGADPDFKMTQSQLPVVTMSIATSEYRTVDGQKQETTEWHRVVTFGKQAELCKQYLSKGRTVFIEGRIQTRSWEDQNGQKKYMTEVIANSVRFVGRGAQSSDSSSYEPAKNNDGPAYQGSNNPPSDSDIPDLDDIPF